MIVLPFEFTPHRVVFRYKHNWWRKKNGTCNYAEKFVVDDGTRKTEELMIQENELVAIPKHKLDRKQDLAFVIEEFDVCPRKLNL